MTTSASWIRPVPFGPADRVYALREERLQVYGPVPRTPAELIEHARTHAPDPARRARALALLEPRWRALELSPAAAESLRLVRQPGTHLVVTGQQPALAGGPLHLFAKAISVARLARWLRAHDVPAIAIFWIGDQDHDVGELEPGLADPAEDPAAPRIPWAPGRLPIADLRLARAAAQAQIERLIPACDASAHAAELRALLAASFDPAPAVWFRRLLGELLADEGLLPLHPEWIAPLIAEQVAAEPVGRLVEEVDTVLPQLAQAGLPAPVPRAAAAPFFWCDPAGGRQRLVPDGAGFISAGPGGERLDRAALLALAREAPMRLSPDVLLRPLVQNAALEPLAVVAGPTEMAYLLELAVAYERRGVWRPLVMPRLRVRVLDQQLTRALSEFGLDPVRLAGSPARVEDLVRSPAAETLAAEFETHLGAAVQRLAALAEDPGTSEALRRRARRLGPRWAEDLEKLVAVLRRDLGDGVSEERALVTRALATLWPHGADAERTLSVFWTLRRYGRGVLSALGAGYDPFDGRARLVALPGDCA